MSFPFINKYIIYAIEYTKTESQEFISHSVNIKISVSINSMIISLYNEILRIMAKQNSANAHLNANKTTIKVIAKFKFLIKTVLAKVIITLKESNTKLILSINFFSQCL
ncbi:MAG: hypothetical protein K0R54_6084 [Clostridiaceae bacterium]|nr:hypothetical protein [Clostridiaceae bacterium]